MKLISLYIENFGGLSRYSLDFEAGITTVLKPNGFGKTTLAEFIRAMLYGFPRKSKTLERSLRQKYTPWNGGSFGGNLIFEHEGQRYRVERTFGATPKGDTFALTDLATNRRSARFSEDLGQELFGLDADSFERSTYLPQLQDDGVLATASIQNKLTALVEDSELVNFEKAMSSLRAKRSAIAPYRGSGGTLAETAAQITKLQLKLDEAKRQETRLRAAQENAAQAQRAAEEMQRQLDRICEELEDATRQAADCRRQREYEQLCRRHSSVAERIGTYREKYPRGIPQEADLRRAERCADRLQQNGSADSVTALQIEACRNDCEEYERLRGELRTVQNLEAQKRVASAAQQRRVISVMLWLIGALAIASGGGLLWMQLKMPAMAAFCAGAVAVAAACARRGKRRARMAELAALQGRVDALNQKMEESGSKLRAAFAAHGVLVCDQQFFAALAQLEHRLTLQAQSGAAKKELQQFFDSFGVAYPQNVAAALQTLREDIRAMQAAETVAAELAAQIERMESTCGDILFAEFGAQRDPDDLKAEERNLRAALREATARLLQGKQTARFLREQVAEIPQLQEKLEEKQRKLAQERENVKLLDATMEYLQQAKENLSTAYLGTIQTRFDHHLLQLEELSQEGVLIDTDLRIWPECFGKARELAYFSAGQADLMMLCMRLALVDALFQGQGVCLILDDPFVNLDDAHMEKARQLLQKLAHHRQILYLTCHSGRSI